MSDTSAVDVPLAARVNLCHAYVQLLADHYELDVLHVKGPAVAPELTPAAPADALLRGRHSSDVDVLVRPAHLNELLTELRGRGWTRMTGFEQGSAFGHAMNLRSEDLGLLDVHRSWPGFGIDADLAFDRLWRDRGEIQIAHVACAVPSLESQRLILLLHFARSGGQRQHDLDRAWTTATAEQRAQVRTLARRFDAELPLAAAIDELEAFRGQPSYRLWKHFRSGDTGRFSEWSARWHAAQGAQAKLRVARGFVEVNPDLLRLEVGGEPTLGDWVAAYRQRGNVAAQEAWSGLTGRWSGGDDR